MKFTACIFARDGSKGLPGKNIKYFNGKPLIGWSIYQAKKTKYINKVIVSTDSQEIANVAIEYGAEVPFLRPKKLATDKSPEWHSWKHLVNYLKTINELPEALVSVPATSPLRSYNDIENCINKYIEGGFDSIVTGTQSKRSPYFNMVKKNKDGSCSILDRKFNKTIYNRQTAPLTYDLATVCYVISTSFIQNNDQLFSGKVGLVEIPEERAIDIDSLWDFEVANLIYLNLKNENEKK